MRANERWSMDFVSDCVSTGRVIRTLTVVDDCTRECPAIEVDTSLGGLRVRRVLDRIASERGLPEAIVLDNGPEFRGRALAAWSEERGVRLEFIQPGKPVQNAYAESFNGRLRDECLNANWFTSLSDARRKIETDRLSPALVACPTVRGHCAPGLVAGRYQPLADDVTIAGDVRPNPSSAVDSEDEAKRPSREAPLRFGLCRSARRQPPPSSMPLPPRINGLCPGFAAYLLATISLRGDFSIGSRRQPCEPIT